MLIAFVIVLVNTRASTSTIASCKLQIHNSISNSYSKILALVFSLIVNYFSSSSVHVSLRVLKCPLNSRI